MRGPFQLLKDGFHIFMENPKLFIGIMLLPAVITYIIALLEPESGVGIVGVAYWIMYILLMLVLIVVNIAMGVALIEAVNNRTLTIKASYMQAKGVFWRYILLSLLLSVILMIGYILLIIPGIIMTVWFSFAAFILVLEGAGVVDSIKLSKSYVAGKWWKVFGRLCALIIFSTAYGLIISLFIAVFASVVPEWLLALIALALNILITPITIAYMYALYSDLKTSSVPTSETAPDVNPSPTPAV